MKTISVLGSGIGGVVATHELQRKINKSLTYKIFLFEKEEQFTFAPSLPWVMIGKRKYEKVKKKIDVLASDYVQVIKGEVESVDPEKLSVKVNGKEYKSDYIVIALGAETKVEHNLDKYGHNFFSLDGADAFHKQLINFSGGKIVVLVSSLPFKCPAAPYKAAMLIESFIRKRGLRDKTEISLYTPEPLPLPVAGKEVGEAVMEMLKKKRINYFTNHQIESVNEKTISFTNGTKDNYDFLTFTPKHTCPNLFSNSPITSKSGWIEVNRNTLETMYSNVFAIGDITSIPLEMSKPLPKAGVFAHYQAEVVANNIAEKLNGTQNFKTFDGYGECFLELGDGIAGYAKGNFYASPIPAVEIKRPSFWRHLGKVWFEKYWWFKYF
ncbi:MAG: FAD-dependent oxidoreductase [Bacteroidetes bacterium]|nr:FAD-dependent oxidoreductase [Bacteroidota bacterium]MBU2585130.1 FAD-dependent oxidoreductase [Bacteroidota bacterium]